jgi:hypothetical protein
MTTEKTKNIFILFWIIIAILSRILPHVANVTFVTSLTLLAGMRFSWWKSAAMVVSVLLISDIGLFYLQQSPWVGHWMWFTYSGFLAIAFLSRYVPKKVLAIYICLPLFSLGYWIWTNFGTWWVSGLYPHTGNGFINCYLLALPFLRQAVIGDLLGMTILLFGLKALSVRYFPNSSVKTS